MRNTLLILLLTTGAWANTFTASALAASYTGPDQTCTGTTGCSLQAMDASASAFAGFDAFSFPTASVALFATCRVNNTCTEAQGSASFSAEMTIMGAPAGAIGIVELQFGGDGSAIFGTASWNIGLANIGSGPHFGTEYRFVFGQPFTLSGSVQGGCSQCGNATTLPNVGSVRVIGSLYIYDTQGELLDTITRGSPSGQILATVPEPSTLALGLIGLIVLAARRRPR